MTSFADLAREYGSGFMGYRQADTIGRGSVKQNSLTNVFLRMNVGNAEGVCLGLAIGFLFYSRRYATEQPMVWINRFLTDSRAAWESGGQFMGVSELQILIGSIMEDQNSTTQFAACTRVLQEGMWGLSFRGTQRKFVDWDADDLASIVFPTLTRDNTYWLFGVHAADGGHAMALRSMIHPKTGQRLIIFFEPNFGVVQFQGITSGAQMKKFFAGFIANEGFEYTFGNAELYEFR